MKEQKSRCSSTLDKALAYLTKDPIDIQRGFDQRIVAALDWTEEACICTLYGWRLRWYFNASLIPNRFRILERSQ